jgi:hypothetical protein
MAWTGVLSAALRKDVRGVEVIDVVLSRSCLGTDRVWSRLGDAVPLNLTLLAGVAGRAREAGRGLSLRGLHGEVWGEINRVMGAARPAWVQKEFQAGRALIRLPMLDYDVGEVTRERSRMWEGSL